MSDLIKTQPTSACACMGKMYDEPHCICVMESLNLPLNVTKRAEEYAKCGVELNKLFGPGAIFYKEKQ